VILFKSAQVYAPEALGRKDVFVAGGRIVAIAGAIPTPVGLPVRVIEAGELRMIPGLVDVHAHLSGGGGEGGPATRTPAPTLSQFLEGGITTVVGCLGTDGFTRTMEDLLMRAKALTAEGITAYIYCGSYQIPPPTLLGDVAKDLALIEEVVGVGEVALADHRSSGPTVDKLIRLGHHSRIGGMLGGKAGILHIHMGDGDKPFELIYQAVAKSELKITQFFPTHCTRNHHIFEEAKEYAKQGYVDLTAGCYDLFPETEVKPSRAVVEMLQAGVPLAHISISSDTGGSLPYFDDEGRLVKLKVGKAKPLFDELIDLVVQEGLPWEQALQLVTSTPAERLKLKRKGYIQVGNDADIVLLDSANRIVHLVAGGELMIEDGKMLRKGTFEE
jgi:beta-aspartyl-dipeptidase (metallo-type)